MRERALCPRSQVGELDLPEVRDSLGGASARDTFKTFLWSINFASKCLCLGYFDIFFHRRQLTKRPHWSHHWAPSYGYLLKTAKMVEKWPF